MNKIFSLILVLLLSFSLNANENLFYGTWELISGEYTDNEGNSKDYGELNLRSLKVITQTHFSFVTMSGDKFWSSGAGSFTYTNSEYIESPLYTSFNAPEGTKYVFKFRFDGDKWFSSRWEDGKRVEYEVWKKVVD